MVVCGGVWWFAVVCGGLRWFAVDCGGLSFSHTAFGMLKLVNFDRCPWYLNLTFLNLYFRTGILIR